MDERQTYDQDTSIVAQEPTPVDVPRYGSLYAGTTGQRDQMRAVVYYNRKRRIARQG